MRTLIPVIAAALLVGAASADANGRTAAPLSDMFPMLDNYQDIPEAERSHFEVEYFVKSADPSVSDFDLWIEPSGERIDIERGPAGRVNTNALAPYLASNPTVMTTLPKGGGSASMAASPMLELADEIAMSDVKMAVDQTNRAMKKRAGLLAFAAPKVKSVRFQLAPGSSASLRKADGTSDPLSAEDGWISVRPTKRNAGATLVFSEPPLNDAFSE